MKTKLQLAAIALFFTFNETTYHVRAQGALMPPGAPAATMKSLAQIEPRTAITNTTSSARISQSGSYYLTGNLTVSTGDGILIMTNGVSLDLNGFSISSTASTANGTGILLTNGFQGDIIIRNGQIRGAVTNVGGIYGGGGFAAGISYAGFPPKNVLVSQVSVSGCLYFGIFLDHANSTVVESCVVRTIGNYGIFASIINNSSATDCGVNAIGGDQVTDCRGESGSGAGIQASTAQNCYGVSQSGIAVSATTMENCCGISQGSGFGLSANIAQNCYGYSSSGYSISATTAVNCRGISDSGYGVFTTNAQNCNGYTSGNGDGINSWIAHGCYGQSNTGYGVYVSSVASLCYGSSTVAGKGMRAWIANSCDGSSFTIFNKYNMP